MPLPKEWKLLPERLALHLPTRTAVVADMHLGYISARRGDGESIPEFGERARLACLSRLLLRMQVKTLVIAGDLVESPHSGYDLSVQWIEGLHRAGLEVRLVPGNHDRELPPVAHLIVDPSGFRLGQWHILHDAESEDSRQIVHGHVHPCIRSGLLPGEAACFLCTADRILLPAWSDHAAGISVLALQDWRNADCFAVTAGRVVSVGPLRMLQARLKSRPRPFRIGFGLGT